MNRQYIGAKYVPTFANPFEWDNLREYEPLTIVTYNGTAYTSKQTVPVGTALSNTDYWVVTGNYNAQVEAYRQDVEAYRKDVDSLKTPRYVFIGDSYADRVNAYDKNYFTLIKEYMNIADDNFYQHHKGGASFGQGSQTYRFATLLQEIYSSVVNPNTISDIYICCGANDAETPVSDTITGLIEFNNLAKTLFPRAKKTIVCCGLTFTDTGLQKRRVNALNTFTSASTYRYGMLKNAEYILCDTKLLESDYCHPNQYGVDALGYNIASGILSNSCYVFKVLTRPNVTGEIVDQTYKFNVLTNQTNIMVKNGVVTVTGTGAGPSLHCQASAVLNIKKSTELRFALDESIYCGTIIPNIGGTDYPATIVNTVTNKKYQCTALFSSISTKHYIRIFLMEDILSADSTQDFDIYFQINDVI